MLEQQARQHNRLGRLEQQAMLAVPHDHLAIVIAHLHRWLSGIWSLILHHVTYPRNRCLAASIGSVATAPLPSRGPPRSEEHTSELQSQSNLVCRLLLE